MQSYTKTIVQHIASIAQALQNCKETHNSLWVEKHYNALEYIAKNYLPSGSGIDSGTTIDTILSRGDKIVLDTSFHHMNESGMYDSWTDHIVRVYPTFDGFRMTISGTNRNDIKDYLYQVFDEYLSQEIDLEKTNAYLD